VVTRGILKSNNFVLWDSPKFSRTSLDEVVLPDKHPSRQNTDGLSVVPVFTFLARQKLSALLAFK